MSPGFPRAYSSRHIANCYLGKYCLLQAVSSVSMKLPHLPLLYLGRPLSNPQEVLTKHQLHVPSPMPWAAEQARPISEHCPALQ